jgi:glycine dehydrogenase subunit 1
MAFQYIPVTEEERQEMLRVIGVDSIEALFADIPQSVRLARPLNLGPPLSDPELWALLRRLADQNGHCDRYTCFLGAGAYDHYVPSVVWHLAGRGEFLTAYTPYQAEIMQGELQAIYEYQTLLCELLAMDVANASMYDGASALAEATVMARDLTKRDRILVSRAIHPEYRQVIQTYTRHLGMEIVEIPLREGVTDLDDARDLLSEKVAALVLQIPNFFGCIEDGEAASEIAHKVGALLVVGIADPLAMGILRPPGEYGADIVAGEGQPLGNHLNFGGPYLGMMATRQEYVRRIPGRLVGATVDVEGRRGFVLTLQTREQHIRRERATSNICTNESLNALAAAIYMVALGKQGIQKVAELNLRKAHYAKTRMVEIPGFSVAFRAPTFHEFAIRCPLPPEELNRRLLPYGIIGGLPLRRFYPELADGWLLCVTEARSREEIDRFVDLVKEVAA